MSTLVNVHFYCFIWLLFLVHFHFCFSTNACTWGNFSSQFLDKDEVNVIELVYFLACKISSVNIQLILAFISMVVINHFYIRTKLLQTLLSVKNLWYKKLKKAFYVQIQSREDRLFGMISFNSNNNLYWCWPFCCMNRMKCPLKNNKESNSQLLQITCILLITALISKSQKCCNCLKVFIFQCFQYNITHSLNTKKIEFYMWKVFFRLNQLVFALFELIGFHCKW